MAAQQESLGLTTPQAKTLSEAGGVVELLSLQGPEFNPKQEMTMAQYMAEIGVRMAERPRESSITDSALGLFGKDFDRAEPGNLKQGLYVPRARRHAEAPLKGVATVWSTYTDIDREAYPGVVDLSTGVALPADYYELITKNSAYMANSIYVKTLAARQALAEEVANSDDQDEGPENLEVMEHVAGESVIYAMTNKIELLEGLDEALLEQREVLARVGANVVTNQPKRVSSLEPYRLETEEFIQEMIAVACRRLGYGTNQTNSTRNAAASNMHRSPEAAQWLSTYTNMAIDYNDAIRGKIDQGLISTMDEIGKHAVHAIANIDRIYED